MSSAIFIGIPHGGLEVPTAVQQRLRADIDAAFIVSQSDVGTALVFGALDRPCEIFPWSRLFIDANRSPDQLGRGGVVPRIDFDRRDLYRPGEAPDEEEIMARIEAVHAPYHQRVATRLVEANYSLFIDGHSMAAQAPARSPDQGALRPLAILGNGGDSKGELAADQRALSCPPSFARNALKALEQAFIAEPAADAPGLLLPQGEICLNRVFRGGYGLRHHSAPDTGRYGLQLELNQGLWCDPISFELNADRLIWIRRVVARWLDALAEFYP